jgi:hypothetical protein
MMESGKWVAASGEAIKFDWNGKLIDGQHRLNAIVDFDKPVKMAVIKNADPETAYIADQGLKRSVSDLITIKTDGVGVSNLKSVAATAATMLRGFETNPFKYPSNDIISEFAIENNEIIQMVVRALGSTVYGKSFIMAAFANAIYHNPDKKEEIVQWCNTLKENFGFTSARDPLNAFVKKVQKLENEKKAKKEVPGRRYYAAALAAVEAKLKGKEVSNLKEATVCPYTNTKFSSRYAEDGGETSDS